MQKNPELSEKAGKFMSEYLELQHMDELPEESIPKHHYFIPHHAITKAHDPEGKVRIVYNASQSTSSGISLNDIMLPGPKLQADLWLVLTRWRLFKYVFATDIVKMYRQILVHPEDCHFQLIVWRDGQSEIKPYVLRTVTYGTKAAPFLALRTLKELAKIERERFPFGSSVLESHTFVDDSLAGGDSITEALTVKEQLIEILKCGGFSCAKWATNHSSICSSIQTQDKKFSDCDNLSTLGVYWNQELDSFTLQPYKPEASKTCTKRHVLSETSKIFDPLGWFSPVLIVAKILIQDLWLKKLEWDQVLSKELTLRWTEFQDSIPRLESIRIQRWLNYSKSKKHCRIHAFCDASERAYAAVVYLRVEDEEGIHVELIASKNKVAPVKTLSIPRLELCGAVLLANLVEKVVKGLGLSDIEICAWSDSMVVLHWLRNHASRWKAFVAHRVSDIQSKVAPNQWRYVPTESNPADVASRGISAEEFENHELWWHGPKWLFEDEQSWPVAIGLPEGSGSELEELRIVNAVVAVESEESEFLQRYSSLKKLKRIMAYMLRFINHRKNRMRNRKLRDYSLSPRDLDESLLYLCKVSQRGSFKQERSRLERNLPLNSKSTMLTVRPFLDKSGCLRLGGRLHNSAFSYDEKHPIILGKDTHFASLVIRDAHERALHAGQELTRSEVFRKFWILSGRSMVRHILRNWVKCERFRAKTLEQVMAPLPATRVTPERPFSRVGVDFAGPFWVKTAPGRGVKAYKGYIALFVCMVSKAVHLEFVSGLSTELFLAAFHRFVSRRGHCAQIFSDNGTNFKGASAELNRMFQSSSKFYGEASGLLAELGTKWKFIPPSAPHFGGLWEAGVKSVKYHLRRVIGEQRLTFEEMSTLLCKIEACLNSRPLYPVSNDPKDPLPLTPGHFLINTPLTAVPEPPVPSRETALSIYKSITNLRDSFWRRWSKEYLIHLQEIRKWKKLEPNLMPETIVLVKEDSLPPAQWRMGRILDTLKSPDGNVRVATIKTATGIIERPIVKLVSLPVQ